MKKFKLFASIGLLMSSAIVLSACTFDIFPSIVDNSNPTISGEPSIEPSITDDYSDTDPSVSVPSTDITNPTITDPTTGTVSDPSVPVLERKIIMDETNGKYVSGNATMQAESMNGDLFDFAVGSTSLVEEVDSLISIKATGKLYNVTKITGIDTVTVNYSTISSSKITLFHGTSSEPSVNSVTLESGVPFNADEIAVDYILLQNLTALPITISSIEITYSNIQRKNLTSVELDVTDLSLDGTQPLKNYVPSVIRGTAVYSDNSRTTLSYDKDGNSGFSIFYIDNTLFEYTGEIIYNKSGYVELVIEYKGIESDSVTLLLEGPGYSNVPTSIDINDVYVVLTLGETYQIIHDVTPEIASKDVDYSILSTGTAVSVDESGLVKADKFGNTTVRVTSSVSTSVYTDIEFEVTEETGYSQEAVDYTSIDYNKKGFAPALGNQKVLMIPIQLSGEGTFTSSELDNIENYTFGTKNNTPDSWNSLKTYYETASFNRINITGEVAPVYQSANSRDYVNSSYYNLVKLMQDALEWVGENGVTLDDYDIDDNGYIDSVHFITKTYSDVWGEVLWPHKSELPYAAGTKANPEIRVYTATTFDHFTDARTIIHEQGHVFGLADYYDYSGTGIDYVKSADMQSGNYFDWNSFSKLTTGWVDPYVINGKLNSTTVTINAAASSGDSLIIPASTWNGSAFDEYILVELFSPKGNNEDDWNVWSYNFGGLGSYGVRLYHVDARLYSTSNSYVINDPDASQDYGTVNYANNNSYDGNDYGGYYLEDDFALLELISKNKRSTTQRYLNSGDLFVEGDTFSFSKYSNYFTKTTTMNNGEAFPYELSFSNMSADSVTVTVKNLF